MANLLVFPITLTSVIIYIALTFFGNSRAVLALSFIITLIVLFFCLSGDILKNLVELRRILSIKHIISTSPILLLILIVAYILYPMSAPVIYNNFTFVQSPNIGDHIRNLYLITTLNEKGLPLVHPYFPDIKMSYYFGFYLIPAAFSKLFFLPLNSVFYVYLLITYLIFYLLLIKIYTEKIKSFFYLSFASLLLSTSSGFALLHNLFVLPSVADNFRVLSYYMAILLNPQHVFPAIIAIFLLFQLINKEKINIIILISSSVFIAISSVFIAFNYALWLLIIFILKKELRRKLCVVGIASVLILAPFIIANKTRQNSFLFYLIQPLSVFLLNLFLKYGPLFILLLVLIVFLGKGFFKKYLSIIIGLLLPVTVSWFLSSGVSNIFSQRLHIPLQLTFPLFFVYCLKQIKNSLAKALFMLVGLICIIFGVFNLINDFKVVRGYKEILLPEVSELLIKLREMPEGTTFAVIQKDSWVHAIPPFGFKLIYAPYLWESNDFVQSAKEKNYQYEKLANNIFIQPTPGTNERSVLETRNNYFKSLGPFFQSVKPDYLLISNKLGVKKDINPWLFIFQEADIPIEPTTPYFTLIDYKDLKLLEKITIQANKDENQEIIIKDHKFYLKKGLWLLVACNKENKDNIKLEFEEYYPVFDEWLQPNSCFGTLFYHPAEGDILVTKSSTVGRLQIYPVEITTNPSRVGYNGN